MSLTMGISDGYNLSKAICSAAGAADEAEEAMAEGQLPFLGESTTSTIFGKLSRHWRGRARNIMRVSTCHAIYRVTIQLVQNLPLTSKLKFLFGLAGQAKPELLF